MLIMTALSELESCVSVPTLKNLLFPFLFSLKHTPFCSKHTRREFLFPSLAIPLLYPPDFLSAFSRWRLSFYFFSYLIWFFSLFLFSFLSPSLHWNVFTCQRHLWKFPDHIKALFYHTITHACKTLNCTHAHQHPCRIWSGHE